MPEVVKDVECCGFLTGPTPLVLALYTNLVVGTSLGTAAVGHINAIEFVKMELVRLLNSAERHVVRSQCYEPWMGQGGCGVLVQLSPRVRCAVSYYGYKSLAVG